MFTPDDEFLSHNKSDLPPQNEEFESEETTIEDFFDKVTIEEKKQEKKVVIIKRDNNSGTGEEAPESVANKFNWGAFLFNWIWGLKYKKWVLLSILVLTFIPYGFIAGIILCIIAGMKGNQWAWEEIEYKNEEDFHHAQQKWVKAWLILLGISVILGGLIWASLPQKHSKEISMPNYSFFSSTELEIPQEVYDKTTQDDKYIEFLTSNKYIIYWLKPKNDFTEKNKQYIEDAFEKKIDILGKKFILNPELIEIKDTEGHVIETEQINENSQKQDVRANCSQKDAMCIEAWLYKTCNNGYCIMNPLTKKYYKIRGKENVIPRAMKILKLWN